MSCNFDEAVALASYRYLVEQMVGNRILTSYTFKRKKGDCRIATVSKMSDKTNSGAKNFQFSHSSLMLLENSCGQYSVKWLLSDIPWGERRWLFLFEFFPVGSDKPVSLQFPTWEEVDLEGSKILGSYFSQFTKLPRLPHHRI